MSNPASRQSALAKTEPSFAVPRTMLAAVARRFGAPDDVRVEAVLVPTAGNDQVLVRVHAASVCRGDIHLLAGKPYLVRLAGFGLFRPKYRIPGQNVSGVVVATGRDVTGLSVGDAVFGEIPHGAFAQYAAADAKLLVPKPANLTHEEAAATPVPGMTALQALRDAGKLRPGQSLLINGASGAVGTFAVQIAKALGAEVTVVCSPRHAGLMRRLGVVRVIDYTAEDFTRSGRRHDVVLDLMANRTLRDCKRVLKPHGIFISGAVPAGQNWIGPIVWMLKVALADSKRGQRFSPFLSLPRREDLIVLKAMMEEGRARPVIEHSFALTDTAKAMAHVAGGHAQGVSVISVVDA